MTAVLKQRTREIINMNALFRDGKHPFKDYVAIQAQQRLVQSELDEFCQAVLDNDFVEAIDAVGDIFVTGVYLAYLCSYDNDDFWNRWTMLENQTLFCKTKLNEQYKPSSFFDFLMYEFNFQPENTDIVLYNLFKMVYYFDFYSDFELVVEKALQDIQDSNDTKFPLSTDKDEAERQVDIQFIKEYHLDKKNESIEVEVKECGDDRIAYINSKTGKFLKPKTFTEPDLSWIMEDKEFCNLIQKMHNSQV